MNTIHAAVNVNCHRSIACFIEVHETVTMSFFSYCAHCPGTPGSAEIAPAVALAKSAHAFRHKPSERSLQLSRRKKAD
jgi:hypothetical protein